MGCDKHARNRKLRLGKSLIYRVSKTDDFPPAPQTGLSFIPANSGAMRVFPRSFGFFLATAIVYVLQLIPVTGVFLMFMLAMVWSVLLINAGMIGTGWEALTGRVSHWWLVLPVTFYAGYFAFAAADHLALRQLGASYDAANASVAIPFDPVRQALVFGDGADNSSCSSRIIACRSYLRRRTRKFGRTG